VIWRTRHASDGPSRLGSAGPCLALGGKGCDELSGAPRRDRHDLPPGSASPARRAAQVSAVVGDARTTINAGAGPAGRTSRPAAAWSRSSPPRSRFPSPRAAPHRRRGTKPRRCRSRITVSTRPRDPSQPPGGRGPLGGRAAAGRQAES